MDSHVFFTVITVNLNNLAGLVATAESLLHQDHADFEWWVLDGGSTDGSTAYLAEISDRRLSYVSEKDRGIYDAMNSGLDRAVGRYVIFMNAGDRFADSGVLGDVRKFIDGRDIGIVYGDAIEVGGGPESLKRALPHWIVAYSMFTHHQAMFYLRRGVGKARYDLTYSLAADWAFTARLLKKGVAAKHFKRVVCRFQRGGASQSLGSVTQAEVELRRLHREVLASPWPVRSLLIETKLFMNRIRRLWPNLYTAIRSQW
jgi:putative colanic acid biosynthesis glycosyltransferase